jgi:shikimate kinase
MKIILVGYMGSGKTTIARLLSQKLNLPMLDLDNFIEEKSRMSISEIFKSKGEIHFRKIESQFFKELLNRPGDCIISLGGGTPCYANNHQLLMAEGVISFYLKTSIAVLSERLQKSENRPLITDSDNESLKEFIAKHLFDRSFYYNKVSKVVSTDEKPPEQVANEIIQKLA